MVVNDNKGFIISNLREHTNLIETKEEEYRLVELAQKGDEEARELLITSNLRLVATIATNYSKFNSIPWEDFYQEGTLGLFNAIDKFDLKKGFRFSTYSTYWIRNYCQKLLKRQGVVRLPDKARELYNNWVRLSTDYMKEFGVEPSVAEIAGILEVSEERLRIVINAGQSAVSLDAEVDGDGKDSDIQTSFVDLLEDKDQVDPVDVVASGQIMDEINRAKETLSDNELYVFESLYDAQGFRNKVKTKLIKEGVVSSTDEVDKIYNNAIKKLQNYLGDNPLE